MMGGGIESVVRTSQRIRVDGLVLVNEGIKIIDNLGAEVILPLPLDVDMGKLTGSNIRFQSLKLVQGDKPQETCPMDDYPAHLESTYGQN